MIIITTKKKRQGSEIALMPFSVVGAAVTAALFYLNWRW
jgi:hypothetical protein